MNTAPHTLTALPNPLTASSLVKAMRESSGLTARQLAGRCNLTTMRVQETEGSGSWNPGNCHEDYLTLKAILAYYGVNPYVIGLPRLIDHFVNGKASKGLEDPATSAALRHALCVACGIEDDPEARAYRAGRVDQAASSTPYCAAEVDVRAGFDRYCGSETLPFPAAG